MCVFLHKVEDILHSHAFIYIVWLSENKFFFREHRMEKIVYCNM